MNTSKRPVILASASPRRQELLRQIGIDFAVEPSREPEAFEPGLAPARLVISLAQRKAREAATKHPDALIIAADTLGVLGRRIIAKPHGADEAREMLALLSGKCHRVITGYAILDSSTGKMRSKAVTTRVCIKRLSQSEIAKYVDSGEPLDKAGAYGIQGLGAAIVEKIEGDYSNVVGLPLNALARSLKAFGIRVL